MRFTRMIIKYFIQLVSLIPLLESYKLVELGRSIGSLHGNTFNEVIPETRIIEYRSKFLNIDNINDNFDTDYILKSDYDKSSACFNNLVILLELIFSLEQFKNNLNPIY